MTAVGLDLRRVFGRYPTGVTVLAGVVDGRPVGMAANSFTSVSLDPALVSVCIATSSSTWPVLRASDGIGISVLAAHQEPVSRRLAGRDPDRFAGVAWRPTGRGGVLVEGSAAWFDCEVVDELAAGDHAIVVLAVHDLGADDDAPPLVFHGSRYRSLR